MAAVGKTVNVPVRRMPVKMTARSTAETIPAYVRYFFFIGTSCNVFLAYGKKVFTFSSLPLGVRFSGAVFRFIPSLLIRR
jgi:hypothetical protein